MIAAGRVAGRKMREASKTVIRNCLTFVLCAVTASAPAVAAEATADAFGAREAIEQAALSPDGTMVAFLVPTAGQGSTLFTVSTAVGAVPKAALSVSGAPDRLRDCRWVSNDRVVCTVWGNVKVPDTTRPFTYSRLIAVDADGGNQRSLTAKDLNRRSAVIFGGAVIDWLPGANGEVLLARSHQRTDQTGTNVGNRREGLGVDRIDTRTLRDTAVEQPRADAAAYMTDGLGNVRIAAYARYAGETQQMTGIYAYRYRSARSREWLGLGDYNAVSREGFAPYAVDPDKDVAYGFRKVNGRQALFAKALDGTGQETLLFSRPDVDVDGLAQIGRKRRVVGVTYATDRREIVYFDAELKALAAKLAKALPKSPLVYIADASADESKLLIFAGSDNDPGTYYLFDKATKRLQPLLQKRPQLAGRTLATVQAVRVPTRDGTMMPAYLTLPPGGAMKNLPTIVLPHGGPAARDEWGFDWLPQYFAARGYAVLQPNFRGSEGYGDEYQLENGFRSWRTSIGDVIDAGRWLVAQGIADPAKLGIVGWSYGGYAALQSAVMAPDLFKAVVAVAPVTDFAVLRNELLNWSSYRLASNYLGPIDAEASPAQNAAKITVPVLLAHGKLDSNVGYGESTLMQERLKAAGRKVELLTYPELDHYLEDSAARAQLLERSDTILREAFRL